MKVIVILEIIVKNVDQDVKYATLTLFQVMVYINRCVKCIDSFNYYISSDAVNCFKNDISNCQIEYVYDELTKQSSFDVHLNKINNEWIKPKCALC